MQKANSLPGKWRILIFLVTALLVVVADQLSKTWVRSNLAVGESLPETGWLRLTHVQNTGSAFGLFRDQTILLTVVAFIGIAILLLYVICAYRWFPLLVSGPGRVALGLILGGTIGNLIDRLRPGHVITDFIGVGFWPPFNIADSSTVVGVIIVASLLLFTPARAR